MLNQLLVKGNFNVKVPNNWKSTLMKFKDGDYTFGRIIDEAETLTELALYNLGKCRHETNLDMVNDFLIFIRQKYWDL